MAENENVRAATIRQKNHALKKIAEFNVDVEALYAPDATTVFDNVPEEHVLTLAELLFTEGMSSVYLQECSEEEKEKLVFGYLHRAITSLGNRLEDYALLKDMFEKFFAVLAPLGYGKYFYGDLPFIIDWKSKVSENILKYLAEKSKSVSSVASDREIYDLYTKDMENPLCSYENKPYLSGERLVIVNIKSEAEAEFWKGYFALMKKIREEEYEAFQKIASDPFHPLHGAHLIGGSIHKSYMNALMKHLASSEEVARMQVAADCSDVDITESDFKDRIQSAVQSYNTVMVNPIDRAKAFVMNLLGKIKK